MSAKVGRAVFYAVMFGLVLLASVFLFGFEPVGLWPFVPFTVWSFAIWLHNRATVKEATKTDLDAELRDLLDKYKR